MLHEEAKKFLRKNCFVLTYDTKSYGYINHVGPDGVAINSGMLLPLWRIDRIFEIGSDEDKEFQKWEEEQNIR